MEEKQKRESYYNKEHQQKYQKKIKKLTIPFNLEKEDDRLIFEYLDSVENKSNFVKELIQSHIDSN